MLDSPSRAEGVTLARPVVYSPTFVLVVEGSEVGRLEGYAGEDFFWGLLGMMLDRNDIPLGADGS